MPRGRVVSLTEHRRSKSTARRDILVAEHLALVPPIARTIAANLPPSIEIDDLVSVGNIALVEAARRYRPSEHGGAPFSAYARHRIRGAMLDSVKRRHWTNATLEPLEAAGDPASRPPIETEIDAGQLRRRIDAAIDELPAREQTVIRQYYGPAERKLRDVGEDLGVAYTTVKEIRAHAIEDLRDILQPRSCRPKGTPSPARVIEFPRPAARSIEPAITARVKINK